MDNKFNFWSVFVTPWTKKNRLLMSLYILVLICLILSLVYITTGRLNLNIMWIFLMPIGFYIVNLIVGLLVSRLQDKLPPNPLLQTDCLIINNMLQSPGIAYLGDDKLILKPLIGKQISIPADKLQQIRERRWYNGQGYWGQTIYFEFLTAKQWRLGFGVAQPTLWRDTLSRHHYPKTGNAMQVEVNP